MAVYLRFIILALRSLKSYWRQSLAAIVSVVAGFTAFVLFEGYLQNIYTVYKDFNTHIEMYGDLIIEKKGAFDLEGRAEPWDYALAEEEQKKIEYVFEKLSPQIEAFSRFLQITGSLDTSSSTSNFQGLAYDINAAATIRGPWKWDTYWGYPMQESKAPESQMILGLRLAQRIECLPDKIPNLEKYSIDLLKRPQYRPFLCENEEFQISAMTESGQINALDLSVSGILDRGFIDSDSRYVVLSLPTAQKLFNTKKITYYSLKLKPHANRKLFIEEFNDLIQNNQTKKSSETLSNNSPIQIIPWEDHFFGTLYQQTLSLLNVIRNFLITIIVFIGSMSVFNTLVKLVKERTAEIGMLRSLGFIPRQIRGLFFLESLFLSWAGCLIGSVISLILSLIINRLEITYPSGQFSTEVELLITISPTSYLYGFLLMTIISVLACGLAIRKPTKENISTLLIHT